MGERKNRPQVFINFRGKDERKKLLSHLKHHLKDSNVNVFTDDDAVGEPLENLFKHIRRSRIVIVIFSINYLESEWCLDELVEIRKCLETEKIDFAIPIFYKVKTSHVKEQRGKFGKKFVALQQKHRRSRIRRWKRALRYVAKSIGLTYLQKSSISELDFIKRIVEMVDLALTKISSKDDDNNNNSPETSRGLTSNPTDVNQMLHLSRTFDARDLEISYRQGFMVGSAWKDGIFSSMQSMSYNWGVDPRPVFSPNFAPFVPVPQDYRRTFSYHNNIYQHPPWPHATGLNQYPTSRPHPSAMGYFGGPVGSMNQHPTRIPHQSFMYLLRRLRRVVSSVISYEHRVGEAEDVTSSTSLDFDQYPTIDPTIMHDDIVSTSHATEREDKKSCISFLSSYFKCCFSLRRGAKADDKD